MWSPKTIIRKDREVYHQFYENMRQVQVGDIVFSYFDTKIHYLGIVTHTAVTCQKPAEFGSIGGNWDREGWLVTVTWHEIPVPLRAKDTIDRLLPHLPDKYAPLLKTGDGKQIVYLAAVPKPMADVLFSHLEGFGEKIQELAERQIEDDGSVQQLVEKSEEVIVESIRNSTKIDSTEKQALINARKGQGRFRQNLESIEKGCRITGVTDRRLLRASHIRPWRACESDVQRLDGYNGLLLTPTIDHLFDQGFITFKDDGQMMISSIIPRDQLEKLGISQEESINVGAFSEKQIGYLKYHRENVFRVNGHTVR